MTTICDELKQINKDVKAANKNECLALAAPHMEAIYANLRRAARELKTSLAINLNQICAVGGTSINKKTIKGIKATLKAQGLAVSVGEHYYINGAIVVSWR